MERKAAQYLLLISMILSVNGDYIVRVQVTDYSNPTNRCTRCGNGCCDEFFSTTCTDNNFGCDNEFFICLRPLEAPSLSTGIVVVSTAQDSLAVRSTTVGCLGSPPPLRSTEIDANGNFKNFSSSVFLGLPNPMEFPVVAREWEGIQLYVDVVDRDPPGPRSGDELVNFFQLIPVNISAGGDMTAPRTFHGEFEFSTISLRFQVECSPGFIGERCLQAPDETTGEPTTMPPTDEATDSVLLVTKTNATAEPADGTDSTTTGLNVIQSSSSNIGMVAGIVAGSFIFIAFPIVGICVVTSLVMFRKNKAKKSSKPFNGSGEFNPEQLDNPLYGTIGTTSSLNGTSVRSEESSEEPERNLDNPVYGLPTDFSDPTYATPLDVAVSHYDMDTSYDAPTEAAYYEIETTDAPTSPLTDGQYDTAYGTIP